MQATMMLRQYASQAILALAMLFCVRPAAAATFTWVGGGSNNWMDNSQWNTAPPNYTTASDTFNISGGTTAVMTTNATFGARLNVNSGGSLAHLGGVNSRTITNLHLAGGTLTSNAPGNGGLSSSSALTADAATSSTISLTSNFSLSGRFTVAATLNGSGILHTSAVFAPFTGETPTTEIVLGNTATSSTSFSGGTIEVDGGQLRLIGNTTSSASPFFGGTINVNSGGYMHMQTGFGNGQINVKTGGTAYMAASANFRTIGNLHLQGGTLEGRVNNGARLGDNTAASNVHVDSASLLGSQLPSGQIVHLYSTLNGSGNLTLNTATAGATFQLSHSVDASSTYSGNWTVQQGTLRLAALASGNSNFRLGSGDTINIASSQTLDFENSTGSTWDIRHTITGNGTVTRVAGSDDTLVVRRANDDSSGGFSPGNSAGILTVNAPLDFQLSNVGGHNPQLLIEVTGDSEVPGTDFDQLLVTGNVSGISNLELLVDIDSLLTQADLAGDVLGVVLTTGGTLTGAPLASFTSLNPNWTFDVGYDSNSIMLSNFQFQEDEDPPAAVPEPATWILVAAGLAGVGLIASARRKLHKL